MADSLQVRLHQAGQSSLSALTRFGVYLMENAVRRVQDGGTGDICVVCDLKGFSLANMDYDLVKTMLYHLHTYYPERLGVCLLINAPVLFWGCWAVIKPWINEVTAAKIVFVESMADLAKYIDPQALTGMA